jgi:hypothetical protein
MSRDLNNRFAENRIDFTWHYRRTGARVRQADLANSAARSGSKLTYIISYLNQTHRQSLERAADMDRGVACRLRLKMILRLAKGEAGFCGDDLDCLRSKLGVGIDTGPDSRAAKSKFLQTLRRT